MLFRSCNPDKNGATVRKEVQCKTLLGIVQAALPDGTKAFPRKESGSVLVRRKELCAVVVESQLKTSVAWNYPLAASLSINTDEVEAALREASGGLSFP